MARLMSSESQRRSCLVVLGMHRSGTSALTGAIGLLGAALPSDPFGSDPYNIKGHFEPSGVIEVDEQLLSALGASWYDLGPLNLSNLDPMVLDQFKAKFIQAIEASYNGASLFVLKEPRICRLFPLTQLALDDFGVGVRAIICVRDPREVAQSLVMRNGIDPGLDLSHGFGLWLRYMLEAELPSRGLPRVFVDFSSLLEDWRDVVHKIEERLSIKLAGRHTNAANSVDEFLDRSLRHQRATEQTGKNSTGHSTAWLCYQAFQKLMCNPDDSDALQQLDLIRRTVEDAATIFSQRVSSEPLAACRTELLNVQTRLAVAGNNLAVAENNVRDLNRKSEAFREKISRLKRQKARLEEKRRKLLASTSWRL